MDRWQRGPDQAFADFYQTGKPIIPQIESWSAAHGLALDAPGWKVELAKRVKQAMLAKNAKPIASEYLSKWETMFAALLK